MKEVRMLKPEIIEAVILLVFGPAIGVCLCLRTGIADRLTELAARPFEFLDGPANDQPTALTVIPSNRLELEA